MPEAKVIQLTKDQEIEDLINKSNKATEARVILKFLTALLPEMPDDITTRTQYWTFIAQNTDRILADALDADKRLSDYYGLTEKPEQ